MFQPNIKHIDCFTSNPVVEGALEETHKTMEDEDKIEQLPNLELAQWKFLLTLDDSVVPNKNEIATKLMDVVRKESKFISISIMK